MNAEKTRGAGADNGEDDGEYDDDDESSEEEEEEQSPATVTTANGEAIHLPITVKEEIERRKRGDAKKGQPPNPLVVHALRQYFETGKGDPMVAGGFMALMREIGAVAQSKDHLVKNSEHNIYYLGAKGQEETNEFWQDQLERHEAEVRLLRYGEFMEMQEIKGMSFGSDWCFQELENKENLVGDDVLRDNHIDQNVKASSIDDDNITEDQLAGLTKHFMDSFWKYVNHEQMQLEPDHSEQEDLNQSQSSVSMNQSQSSLVSPKVNVNGQQRVQLVSTAASMEEQQKEWTQETIRQKCRELRDLYRAERRPLGFGLVVTEVEPSPTAKKMSGKKQRKRQRQQKAKTNSAYKKKDHAECIREHLQVLFKLMDQQLVIRTGTGACARLVSSIFHMLSAAVSADPDVARNLSHSAPKLIKLRDRVSTNALEADEDRSRPLWVANAWWELYIVLTMLLSDVIVTLTGDKENRNEYRSTAAAPLTADEKLASRFFESDVSPALMASIQSPLAIERCVSLKSLGRIVCAISVEYAMGLVKPKNTWTLLENGCLVPKFHNTTPKNPTRSQLRDLIMAPRSAAQGTSLMMRLCGTGMIKEESDGTPGMTIIPGPLARKMIQRGIVPFLMKVSRLHSDLVSVDAVGGLAQISCVKDCRTSLLEQPDGVLWLQNVLASSEGNKVSQALLLLRHLLWDDEWLEPILSIEPPIEQTVAKWMSFCMKTIRERAEATRLQNKRLADEFLACSLSKIKLSTETTSEKNIAEQQKLDAEIKAMEIKLKNELSWNKLETEDGRTHITNLTLSRGVIFLSTLIRDKKTCERVLKANGLALGAACLDVPVDDTNSAAANIIGNYLTTATIVSPNVFPDPDHVVRAAISRLSRLVNRQDITPRSFIFVRLLNGLRKNADWAPFFQSCAEQDMEHKYVIEVFLPKIGDNIPSSAPPKITTRRLEHGDKANGGRPRPNRKKPVARPTPIEPPAPKLNRCDACGILESKADDFKKCSLCNVTYYCGRSCQTDAWKKHKKECPTLAAAAKKKASKKSNKKKQTESQSAGAS